MLGTLMVTVGAAGWAAIIWVALRVSRRMQQQRKRGVGAVKVL